MEHDDGSHNTPIWSHTSFEDGALIGRAEELLELERLLAQRQIPAQIVGAPRVGKTALSRSFAAKNACHIVDVSGQGVAEILAHVGERTLTILDQFDASLEPRKTLDALLDSEGAFWISSRQTYLEPPHGVVRIGELRLEHAMQLLHEMSSHRVSDEHLEKLVAIVGAAPGVLSIVSSRIAEVSALQLLAEVEFGIFGERLDIEDWELALSRYPEAWRGALVCCAAFEGLFDLNAFRAIMGVDRGHLLEDLLGASLLERVGSDAFAMPWPVRETIRRQAPPSTDIKRRVALHFVERIEQKEAPFGEHELVALEAAYDFGLMHDADIAARAAIGLVKVLRDMGRGRWLIGVLETAISCREKVVGDPLLFDLLVWLAVCERNIGDYTRGLETIHRALVLHAGHKTWLSGKAFQILALIQDHLEHFDQALAAIERAEEIFEALGSVEEVGRARMIRGIVLWSRGEYREAIASLERVRDMRSGSIASYHLGWMWSHLGDTKHARAYFIEGIEQYVDSVSVSAKSAHHAVTRFVILQHMFLLDILEGDEASARERYDELEAISSTHEWQPNSSHYWLLSSVVFDFRFGDLRHAQLTASKMIDNDDPSQAWEGILLADAIAAILDQPPETPTPHTPSRRAKYSIRKAHRDLCIAFAWARRQGDFAKLAHLLEQIDDLEQACRDTWSRLLLRDLRARVSAALPEGNTITIGPGLSWIQVGDKARVDLRRTSTTRQLLSALVEQHLSTPGTTCLDEELIASGWPGESENLSIRTRFHTAIHRLRQRLLGDLLETREDGYCLSAGCRVEQDLHPWQEEKT